MTALALTSLAPDESELSPEGSLVIIRNAMDNKLKLEVQDGMYGVCRLPKGSPVPRWVEGKLTSVTRTDDELSVVCQEDKIPGEIKCEKGWRAMKVLGPLDFSLVGVLASLAAPLAKAGISIFAISTFETDYLLVKKENIEAAVKALTASGHTVVGKKK